MRAVQKRPLNNTHSLPPAVVQAVVCNVVSTGVIFEGDHHRLALAKLLLSMIEGFARYCMKDATLI